MAKQLPYATLSNMKEDDAKQTSKRPILTLKSRKTPLRVDDAPLPEPASTPPEKVQKKASERPSDAAATALSDWLSRHSSAWQDFQPLSIGVVSEVYRLLEIHAMQETWSKRVVHKTLLWHTTRTQYVQNIQQGTHRFSLDGQIAGEISAAQREYATNQLKLKNHHRRGKK